MLKIGLTGGIGSGKSTVAAIFKTLGIPVYYADAAARELMNSDETLKTAIQRQFGQVAYKNGRLDRAYLASVVFSDPYQLEQLNALIHPVTIRDAENWMKRQSSPYAIKEAAVLFESGAAENLDYVIGVTAPLPLRIHRVMQRDHLSREEIMKRVSRQVDDRIKMKLCDFVLVNDEQQPLLTQVMALHEQLIALSHSQP